MITFRLFHALKHPSDTHPLFQHITHQPIVVFPWYVWLISLVLLGFFLLPVMLIVYLVFSASVFGMRWLIDIMNTFTKIVKQNRHDLLSVTPQGEFGVHWLMISAHLHWMGAFERLNGVGFWIGRIGILLAGFYFVTTSPSSLTSFGYIYDGNIGLEVAVVSAIASVFFIHHYQAIAFCVLTGLLIPTYTDERRTAPMVAVGVFLGLQVSSYILFIVIEQLGLSALTNLIDLSFEARAVFLIVFRMLCFVLIREFMVLGLWRLTLRRYYLTYTEAVHLLDGANH